MNGKADRFNIAAARPVGLLHLLRAIVAGSKLGWAYWRAAEQDERNGFPFTAAMEWHRAAQCFHSVSFVSEYCWREWERIVHLPRQFANPIGEREDVVLLRSTHAQDTPAVATAGGNVIPVATAA